MPNNGIHRFPLYLTRCRIDGRRDFANRLDHRLARLKKHRLEIDIALNSAHDIVRNHAAVAKLEDRFLFRAQHCRTNAPVFLGAALVYLRRLVGRGYREVGVIFGHIFGLSVVRLRFACRPPPCTLPMPLAEIAYDLWIP